MKAIGIKITDTEPSFCRSKWLGNPDMPIGMEYPDFTDATGDQFPYNFICQIRLEEIAGSESAELLPPEGILYFFAKVNYFLGRDIPDDHFLGQSLWSSNDVAVVYVKKVDEALFEEKVVYVDEQPFAPKAREVIFYQNEKGTPESYHQLFGSPYCYPYASWGTPCADWQLLLQVDSDEGNDYSMQFMDMGLLYFIISPADLKKHDFSKVQATISSL